MLRLRGQFVSSVLKGPVGPQLLTKKKRRRISNQSRYTLFPSSKREPTNTISIHCKFQHSVPAVSPQLYNAHSWLPTAARLHHDTRHIAVCLEVERGVEPVPGMIEWLHNPQVVRARYTGVTAPSARSLRSVASVKPRAICRGSPGVRACAAAGATGSAAAPVMVTAPASAEVFKNVLRS